jgi:hypothetical protein
MRRLSDMEHDWIFVRDSNAKGQHGKPAKLFKCKACCRQVWSIPGIFTDDFWYPYLVPMAAEGFPCLAVVMPSYGNLPTSLPGIELLS